MEKANGAVLGPQSCGQAILHRNSQSLARDVFCYPNQRKSAFSSAKVRFVSFLHLGERPESESETRGYAMINDLRPYDRDWTIKVVRVPILSLLLIDCLSVLHTKGTRIQAVIFNDVIDKLDYLFLKERTYLVSNGLVKPTNHSFPSVHKEIEMTLSSQANIEDAKIGIELDMFLSWKSSIMRRMTAILEGMHSEIHEALRNVRGRSYIFTTKLDKMSGMDHKSGKIIAEQVQNDEDAKGIKNYELLSYV
ncbi:hypothetical protein RHGRI_025641 [Rhododendron griersonianum]|uniref:Uncharacterized protein n=1 Tax=Rhododendron griersonianum TaxID=479676 RepID=A0AAV6IPR3_9ERIC|nr:hypothetical protein RHGRI_025641 [Rhododendron griersonianum]